MLSTLKSCFRTGGTSVKSTKYEISEDLHSMNKESSSRSHLPLVVRAKGHHIYLDNGNVILDTCGGAAVACLGHSNKEVLKAMKAQAKKFSYISWAHFESRAIHDLQDWLVRSSHGTFLKAYLMSSGKISQVTLISLRFLLWLTEIRLLLGSEAMDGAMKLAREYFVWKDEPQRVNFIARQDSCKYLLKINFDNVHVLHVADHVVDHGATIGALALGGHVTRRAPFEGVFPSNVRHVSACNAYRQRLGGESDADFVQRKAEELDATFRDMGWDTVCAFVVEPVVGAASGCVPAVPGYLRAMKEVCDKYGALLIFDEGK